VGDDFADRVRASLQKKGFWLSTACPANADVGYCRTPTKSKACSSCSRCARHGNQNHACPSGKHPNGKWQRQAWTKSAIQSTGEAPAEKRSTAGKKQEKTVADRCHRSWSWDSDYPRCNQFQTITAFAVLALQKREQHAILPPKGCILTPRQARLHGVSAGTPDSSGRTFNHACPLPSRCAGRRSRRSAQVRPRPSQPSKFD
jgi:hypothetical protein